MTIGVGFVCQDGIVLCSDREMTGPNGYKYQETKILRSTNRKRTIAFSYAGYPDEAKAMFRKVCEGLDHEFASGIFDVSRARTALERIFNDRLSKGLQALMVVSWDGAVPHLFKAWERTITDPVSDLIGWGDSSVIRYLGDILLNRPAFKSKEAEVIGAYLIFVATRFVGKCGGGMDIVTIEGPGKLSEHQGDLFPNQREKFFRCEEEIGRALETLLLSGGTLTLTTGGAPS
jgi:hypothetical protein